MGIPSFFGWLTKRYPSVIVPYVQKQKCDVNEVKLPIDTLVPNPNDVEFDNLYLDMNEIIHDCTHPENKPAPSNEDQMMIAIFKNIDQLFTTVRPRKLLYMAIDGVAPRAKINQQRARRFRASKEMLEKLDGMKLARERLLQKGVILPPKQSEGKFDTNCITPGTVFMARLSECLNYYIHDKMNNDSRWNNIKVILSDSNVPGEGEHKIMEFIRKQRVQPNYDANMHHCLYGSDADFIMLGLATHEVNFTILRKKFNPSIPKPCDLCGQNGHNYEQCEGNGNVKNFNVANILSKQKYILVRLNILREYLEIELKMPNLPFEYDFERVIDDWVFLCILIGNDFLPRLPNLDIREGAIDKLVQLYKEVIYKTRAYLTRNGNLSLVRIELLMSELAKFEDATFTRRHQHKINCQAGVQKKRLPRTLNNAVETIDNPKQVYQIRKGKLELKLVDEKYNEECDSDDKVQLWKEGFKDRYYEAKFGVEKDNLQFRSNVVLQYVNGLCWVSQYYYQGCPSWKWYYPYHYPPFASDFINIAGLEVEFETKTKPMSPLEQLMSVFPASSRSHVPQVWADLMIDETSPIIEFYPKDFEIDLNGNKFAWQGVVLLPFVDENILVCELGKVYNKLTPAEKERNTLGSERLYIGLQHERYQMFDQVANPNVENYISIDGIQGTIFACKSGADHGQILPSPIECLPLIENNRICCVSFRCFKYPEGFVFPSAKLKGALEPLRILKPQDLVTL